MQQMKPATSRMYNVISHICRMNLFHMDGKVSQKRKTNFLYDGIWQKLWKALQKSEFFLKQWTGTLGGAGKAQKFETLT